jgi:uroporphyrinogen III methyltransferase/synthase
MTKTLVIAGLTRNLQIAFMALGDCGPEAAMTESAGGSVIGKSEATKRSGSATTEKNDIPDIRRMARVAIGSYQWIVFTSRHGVRFFFEILDELSFDIRALGSARIASVGRTTTAELKNYRLYPDLEPASAEEESAEGLVACFREAGITGCRILLPRSDKGLPQLPDGLRALGNRTTEVAVYTNTFNGEAARVDLSAFGEILFSSPSGVDAFMRLYGALPEGVLLTARGKTTKDKLISHSL